MKRAMEPQLIGVSLRGVGVILPLLLLKIVGVMIIQIMLRVKE